MIISPLNMVHPWPHHHHHHEVYCHSYNKKLTQKKVITVPLPVSHQALHHRAKPTKECPISLPECQTLGIHSQTTDLIIKTPNHI